MVKRLLLIAWIIILLVAGCSLVADKRVVVKPKPVDTSAYAFRRTLAMFVKQRYKTEMTVDEIMAELAYQEYLQQRSD